MFIQRINIKKYTMFEGFATYLLIVLMPMFVLAVNVDFRQAFLPFVYCCVSMLCSCMTCTYGLFNSSISPYCVPHFLNDISLLMCS